MTSRYDPMQCLQAAGVALLTGIGDNNREGVAETPARFAKAWATLTSGYQMDPKAVLKCFEDGAENVDQMVFQRNIPLYSVCEHHLLPFFGVAHIAYIPNGRVVGLSKLCRLLEIYSRRIQVQERLTRQVADAMMEVLAPEGVGVVIECRHLCMEMRGIQRTGTVTVTSALHGCMKDEPDARAEFLALCRSGSRDII